jgi:hypothetical protein
MTKKSFSRLNFSANAGAMAVFFLPVLLLGGCAGQGRRTTYLEDIDGIKTKIEGVQRELAADIKTPGDNMVPAPAESAPVKTLSKTGEFMEFEAEGEGVSTKYERPLAAEKRAEEDALAKAVKTAGVSVYTGFQNIMQDSAGASYEYIGKYLNVWSNALVSYERTAPAACELDGETHRCTVKIKGKVYLTGAPDPNFNLKAELDKPAYFEEDSLSLLVKADKDAYLTVLHCDEDGNVELIFPNRHARKNFLPAGEELLIPDGRSFRLTVLLPPGRAETGEMLHVIATKSQPLVNLQLLEADSSGGYKRYSLGGLKELAAKLSRLDRAEWTTRVLFYEAKKRPQ